LSVNDAHGVQRLNVIIFAHYGALATVFPFCCFAEKLNERGPAPPDFCAPFPPHLLYLRVVSLAGETFYKRIHARRAPTSEANRLSCLFLYLRLRLRSYAAVRHGINGETRRSESDTLPLSCVPPRVGAGGTTVRVCVHACVRSLARAGASSLQHYLFTNYRLRWRIESS